ncbi:RNA recognition domain-containing protein [Colletotrichum cuscutae]|uniref:RNA recognition domain-containing protein n=1 Tax=Colletotrichum cuscutae TaxID=1209917 RepID=A0AAI9Y705_9PEZI|nr:RNA recognition domain-containing protein [Colletotrichum cuscutae]
MISDNDLYRLAIFLGSAAMVLIIFYHYVEVNNEEEKPEKAGLLVDGLLASIAPILASAGYIFRSGALNSAPKRWKGDLTSCFPKWNNWKAQTGDVWLRRQQLWRILLGPKRTSATNQLPAVNGVLRPPLFWSGAPQPAAPLAPTPCPVSFPISPSPAHSIHLIDHSSRASFYASEFDSSSRQHFVSHHALHDLTILGETHRPAAFSSQHYRKHIFLSNKSNTTVIMSGKLDQSLDEILSTQRRSAGGPGRRSQRRSTGGRPAAAAPVGGVQKTSRPARGAAANKPNAAKPAQGSGDSKVIVSNLPKDVNEQQIKPFPASKAVSNVAAQARTASIHSFAAIDSRTYNDGWPFSGVSGHSTYTWLFGSETGVTAMCYDVPPQQLLRLGVIPSDLMAIEHEAAMASTGASLGMDADEYFLTSVGPIKRVDISYGPNSVSRGIANITFREADGASKAFQKLNGLLVDNRPIKIEIVVGASQAANVIPPAKKTLAERTTQPKAQPKSAANNKRNNTNAGKGGPAAAGTGGKKPRAKRTGRPAKKTAEELDSEMADYFESGANPNENAAAPAPAPAATNGDAAMEDEIM